jgi:cysteine sulfinate desulfinase/cysteine desulfurase-like protein
MNNLAHAHLPDANAPIYLDFNATTPLCKEAVAAMTEQLAFNASGNPSSSHFCT